MSKNAEGWVRHRGGKCPVEKGVRVDVRYRDGEISMNQPALEKGDPSEPWAEYWSHDNCAADIMAYRLHKPAERVTPAMPPEGCGEVITETLETVDGPLQWRDRITEIDATTQALTTERAELVQKLASEGFALIGRINDLLTDAAQKHEDMSDLRNWKVGDRLVITDSGLDDCVKGEMLTIDGLDFDDDNQPIGAQNDNGIHHWPIIKAGHFKTLTWHSRPSA